MDDKVTPKEVFPPAMLDMGMPNEMNPVDVDSEGETPVLEITKPLDLGEPKEIRDVGSVTLI